MSSYLDSFRRRMFKDGATIQEQITNEGVEEFKDYIFNAPNYFKVKINGDGELNISEISKEYDCTIQDIGFNDKRNFDEKLLCAFNEAPIDIGKYILWNNSYWIVVFKEEKTIKTHLSMVIRPCNNVLRWIDKNGCVQEFPCLIQNQTLYSDGMQEGKDLTLLDTKKSVIIPYNNITKDLEEQQKFLFNNDKRYCYKLSQLDGLSTNEIINLTLTQDEYNMSVDDLENNLCNINKKVKYKIQILSIQNNMINCKQGDNIQLNIQLLAQKNGESELVEDSKLLNKITYTSSDTSKVIVDNKGLLTCKKIGDCDINIVFDDGINKTEERVRLHIIDQTVNNLHCKILGKDKIIVGGKSLYTVEFYDNEGMKTENPYVFAITDENNSPTILAVISSINDKKCYIQATSDVKMIGKTFILKVKSLDGSVKDSIKIKIKSVFG